MKRYILTTAPVIASDQLSLTVQFIDLEQCPAPMFYRWLNDMAMLAGLYTRFIEQDGWFDSRMERWNAIMVLSSVARLNDRSDGWITGSIHTEEEVRQILAKSDMDRTEKMVAVKK